MTGIVNAFLELDPWEIPMKQPPQVQEHNLFLFLPGQRLPITWPGASFFAVFYYYFCIIIIIVIIIGREEIMSAGKSEAIFPKVLNCFKFCFLSYLCGQDTYLHPQNGSLKKFKDKEKLWAF